MTFEMIVNEMIVELLKSPFSKYNRMMFKLMKTCKYFRIYKEDIKHSLLFLLSALRKHSEFEFEFGLQLRLNIEVLK